jgi:hypothetical protein
MTTTDDQNKNIINKKQKEKEAKEDQIEETLENASDKVVAESKKEASQIGDSDRE